MFAARAREISVDKPEQVRELVRHDVHSGLLQMSGREADESVDRVA